MSYFEHLKKQPYPDNDGNAHDIEFYTCPFCGDKPYVTPKGNSHTKRRSVTVKCKTCRIERTDSALIHGFDFLYAAAAKNWNQRSEDNLKTLINDLYKSDIKFNLATLWDYQYSAKLGDNLNGTKEELDGATFEGIMLLLKNSAIKHYPKSEFAKKYVSIS